VILVKNAITMILSVLFLLTAHSVSFSTVPQQLPVAAKVHQITGKVGAINANVLSIIATKKYKDKAIEAAVMVDKTTQILKDKKKKDFPDIRIGDRVIVKYTQVSGKNIAQNISIEPAKSEAEKK
jgi:hypothetical protein